MDKYQEYVRDYYYYLQNPPLVLRKPKLYVIGSLRNPEIPQVGKALRSDALTVFDDWYGAGEKADDSWRDYEKLRGRSYKEALEGWAAKQIFSFDKHHLDTSDAALLVLPAGRSGHLELGYMAGRGKKTFILMDDPERWDCMVQFADKVFFSLEECIEGIRSSLLGRPD